MSEQTLEPVCYRFAGLGVMTDQDFLVLALRASNMAALVAFLFTLLLLGKSVLDFSQTGPPLGREVLRHYRAHLS